jgi:hypothetical protein
LVFIIDLVLTLFVCCAIPALCLFTFCWTRFHFAFAAVELAPVELLLLEWPPPFANPVVADAESDRPITAAVNIAIFIMRASAF